MMTPHSNLIELEATLCCIITGVINETLETEATDGVAKKETFVALESFK